MNTSSARIGYARVSTVDQNPDAQIAALEAAGCTMIRTETRDGATLTGRPELGVILDFIHPGETVVSRPRVNPDILQRFLARRGLSLRPEKI